MTNPQQLNSKSNIELEILKQEYFFLHTIIEDYNKQIWTIKALGITGTGAVIGLFIQQKIQIVCLIGISIPLFFWILESQWKHFQHGFYPRINDIELKLKNQFSLSCPAIYDSWHQAFNRKNHTQCRGYSRGYIRDGLLNPSVFITYILQILFLLILYMLKLE